MSAFATYLKTAIDYEQTHQLLLELFLKDASFRKLLLQIDVKGVEIVREPERGLFDLAVKENGEYIAMLELKAWGTLEDHQLKKQVEFLKKHHLLGYYVLFNTSDISHYKYESYDNLKDRAKWLIGEKNNTGIYSQVHKIGFLEMSKVLQSFNPQSVEIKELKDAYFNELSNKYEWLTNCYQDQGDNSIFKSFSKFFQVQKCVPKLATKIKTVSNRGETKVIMLDDGTWIYVSFKGHDFQLYHELHDAHGVIQHQIRGYNDDKVVPRDIRHQFRAVFTKMMRESELDSIGWDYKGQNRKYIILARRDLQLDSLTDFEREGKIYLKVNTVLHKLAEELKKRWVS